jgi:outer membrane protein OmpA-like peptidoglycan-associated protein
MKLKLVTLAIAFAAAPAYAAIGTTDIPTFAGQAAAQAAAKAATPTTPEEWLARMTDFSRNLSAFKDPKSFVPWANAISEPSFYIAMANSMMDPGGWLNMMNSAAHPDAVRNLLAFADPAIYLKWTAAGLDPNFLTAVLAQLSDPGKLMRWGMAPLDPKLWGVLGNTLNPNTYIRWPMAALDPRAWNLMGTVANPALYTGMLGAVVNPNAYGQGANSWLTWAPPQSVQGAGSFAMWDPIAMLGNLSGWIPGLNQLSLPALPSLPTLPTLPTLPSFPAPTQAAPMMAVPMYQAPVAPRVEAAPQPEAVTKAAEAPAAAPTQVGEPKVAGVAKVEEAKAEAAAPTQVEEPKAAEVAKVEEAKAEAVQAVEVKAPEAPKPVAAAAPAVPPAQVAPPVAIAATPVQAAAPAASAATSKVVLAGDALFKSGKSAIRDLSKEGRSRLDEVIKKLKLLGDIEQIRVVGHADPTGKAATNQKLSEARARSVKSYLIAKGVKPAVIISSGMGDTQPVVQCDKALVKQALKDCHAPNRRVEIEIAAKAK